MFRFSFDEDGSTSGQEASSSAEVGTLHSLFPQCEASQRKRQKAVVDEDEDDDERWNRACVPPTPSVDDLVQYLWHFDMINDRSRNAKFRAAIEAAIQRARGGGRSARALDVGTGSGLLALLAARGGATHVTAVEVESAVASVACRNVKRNGMGDTIVVRCGLSTSGSVQVDGPVDVLVAELLDTGLLGESFLRVIRDANARGWLAPTCRVVPCRGSNARLLTSLLFSFPRLLLSCSLPPLKAMALSRPQVPCRARVFGVLIESEYLRHMAVLSCSACGMQLPSDVAADGGSSSPYDIPLGVLLARGQARALSAPFACWEIGFELDSLPPVAGRSKRLAGVVATAAGHVDAVAFWWSCESTGP